MALLDELQAVFGDLAAVDPAFAGDVDALKKIADVRDAAVQQAVQDATVTAGEAADQSAGSWLADRVKALAAQAAQTVTVPVVTEPAPAADVAVAEPAPEAPDTVTEAGQG